MEYGHFIGLSLWKSQKKTLYLHAEKIAKNFY